MEIVLAIMPSVLDLELFALYKGHRFTALSSTLGVLGIFRDLVYNIRFLPVQTAAQ